MKRVLVSSLMLIGLATTAEARDQFVGTIVMPSYTGDCPDWVAGQEYSVRYRPKTPANGNDSSFALFGDKFGQSFKLIGREFDATLRPVEYGDIYVNASIIGPSSKTPPAVKVSFKSIARTPTGSATSSTTEFLNITGSIQNYEPWDTKTCVVNFRMSLVRKEPL